MLPCNQIKNYYSNQIKQIEIEILSFSKHFIMSISLSNNPATSLIKYAYHSCPAITRLLCIALSVGGIYSMAGGVQYTESCADIIMEGGIKQCIKKKNP